MKNKPIKDFSLGKIKGTVWEGEYQGKPTYSVSFQKSYKDKSGEWKNTNFFTLPDLRDLYSLVGFMIIKQVKEFVKNNKPVEPVQTNYAKKNTATDDPIPEMVDKNDDEIPF